MRLAGLVLVAAIWWRTVRSFRADERGDVVTQTLAAGVAVNVFSGWRHVRLIRTLELGRVPGPYTTTLALATCLFLALVGLGMAIYLISVHDSGGRFQRRYAPLIS